MFKTGKNSKKISLSILVLILSGACLGFLSLYFSTGQYRESLFTFYFEQPFLLILNLLPFIVFNFLFFFLTNRVWTSFAMSGTLCLVFSWANYWKLLARDAPVYAEDLKIISEALDMGSQYAVFNRPVILSFVFVLLITLVLAKLFPGPSISRKQQCFFLIILLLISCLLFFTVYISQPVYDSFANWPELVSWFSTTRFISRGGIYPFINSIPDAFPSPPENYSQADAEEILDSFQTDSIPDDKKVSVISVMLEAYSDLSTVCDKISSADPYTLYHQLQEESYCGTLVPNIFAGGTNITEQNFLTGFSALGTFRTPTWSYARYFADQGYQIDGAHAGYQGMYSRNVVNQNIGFPEYRFIDNYYLNLPDRALPSMDELEPDMKYYLANNYADAVPMDFQFLTDVIACTKEKIESGTPVFSYNLTYQNHGPYFSTLGLFPKEYVPRGSMSEEDYNIVNNYLTGIEDTTRRVYEMVDAFRDYEEPVVLVFFGDHKPWLGNQNSTYYALGIDILSGTDESFMNYYATEYLIWANDAAKEALDADFVGTGPTISPCFLMNVLFDLCGWEGPNYKKLTDQVMDDIPVIHQTGVYLNDGRFVAGDQLPADHASSLHKMNCAQFYLMHEYMDN